MATLVERRVSLSSPILPNIGREKTIGCFFIRPARLTPPWPQRSAQSPCPLPNGRDHRKVADLHHERTPQHPSPPLQLFAVFSTTSCTCMSMVSIVSLRHLTRLSLVWGGRLTAYDLRLPVYTAHVGPLEAVVDDIDGNE